MEANKDEAERCIQRAANALLLSNMAEYQKYLIKAMRMYPDIDTRGKCTLFNVPMFQYLIVFLVFVCRNIGKRSEFNTAKYTT